MIGRIAASLGLGLIARSTVLSYIVVALGGEIYLAVRFGPGSSQVDRFRTYYLFIIPVSLIFVRMGWEWLQYQFRPDAESGRSRFETTWITTLKGIVQREHLPVSEVKKKDPDAPALPTLQDDRTSTMILGQSGKGKSKLVQSRIQQWDYSRPLIVHEMSQPGKRNEYAEFFEAEGQDVELISSRNSSVRWDPFLDCNGNFADMENIAEGILSSEDAVETGWSQHVRSYFVCALALTNAEYGDFACLDDVLGMSPTEMLDECEKLSNSELYITALSGMDEDDLRIVHSNLLNRIRPMLQTDFFDSSLPRISITEYVENPAGRVIVVDHIGRDSFADGLFKFFFDSAIEYEMEQSEQSYFVLDEFDELPYLSNLKRLITEGRSTNTLGFLITQDLHQIHDKYGELAETFWSNCTNRIMFRPGDSETAELALSSIGTYDVQSQSKTDDTDLGKENERFSQSVEEKHPISTHELTTDFEVGDAVVISDEGWWVTNLKEPKIEHPDDEIDENDKEETDEPQGSAVEDQQTTVDIQGSTAKIGDVEDIPPTIESHDLDELLLDVDQLTERDLTLAETDGISKIVVEDPDDPGQTVETVADVRPDLSIIVVVRDGDDWRWSGEMWRKAREAQ